MAEVFIEEIYKYSKIYTVLKKGIKASRRIRNDNPMIIFNGIYKELCNCCSESIDAGFQQSEELTKLVIEMKNYTDDMMLLSDHVQSKVLPLLEKWIAYVADISVETEDGFFIKSSKAGYLTIQYLNNQKFIHSTYDPMEEAEQYIEYIYDPSITDYIFFGCGMGYYLYQLYLLSDGTAHMTVYERDEKLVEYAEAYGVIDWIPKGKLEIVVDKDCSKFLSQRYKKDKRIITHLSEVDAIDDFKTKEAVMQCFLDYNTTHLKQITDINVYRNIQAGFPDATELKGFIGKEVVIVAAGPSLDDNLGYLKQWKGEKTIVAVNTVFRKLIQKGIVPDYVVAVDPSEKMIRHLEGVEKEKVPLIIDIGTYWRWGNDYKGPKYLAYSTTSNIVGENYIKINKKEKWIPGGTVTFFALELAIRCEAEKIYLIGADFGYPNGVSHAEGTAFQKKIDSELNFEVESVDGGMIQTDRILNRYRLIMEERIRQVRDKVEVYNLSANGAKINGTKKFQSVE